MKEKIKLGMLIEYANGNLAFVNKTVLKMIQKEYDEKLRHNFIHRLDIIKVYKTKEI